MRTILGVTGLIALGAGAGTPAWAQPPSDAAALDSLTRIQHYQARRESSSNQDVTKNSDSRPIEPGATLVLADVDGPGVITHVWTTINTKDPFYPRSLIVRIYWDGSDKPSVEAPLGDFFGVGNAARASFTSAPVVNSAYGRARSCFWEMPFRKHAKVTVTNDSNAYRTDSFYYYLDWRKYDALPDDIAYFHAQYRQQAPAEPGNYTILDTKGRGHYVGTVYSVLQTEIGWFGEGDDFFFVDGEEVPSLRGTGTEDYFGDAWGFRTFETPYFGVPVWEGYYAGDRVSAYRWHIKDPIPFTKSLKVTIEHKGSIYGEGAPIPEFLGQYHERPDWVSSVAFWYQTPAAGPATPLPPLENRVAPYRVIGAKSLEVKAAPEQLLVKSDDDILYLPSKPDARLEVTFDAAEPGRYQVNAILTYSFLGGVYQPFLDDRPIGGPLDLCIAGEDEKWVCLDLHDLVAGKHTLRFEGRGASPNTRTLVGKPNGFGMTKLVLLRLEDVPGYQRTLKSLEAAPPSAPAAPPAAK